MIEPVLDSAVATAWPPSVLIVRQPAASASFWISAVSASSCFSSTLSALDMTPSILAPMSDTPTTIRPGLAGVEVLAELLEVLAAHAGRRVPGERTERRATTGRRSQQSATDGGRREQRDDQAGGETDTATTHCTDTCGRLVLLDDLDLAVVLALDDGGIVGVDETFLGVEIVDRVVVGLRVVDVRVHPDVRHECVHRHVLLLRSVNCLTTPS